MRLFLLGLVLLSACKQTPVEAPKPEEGEVPVVVDGPVDLGTTIANLTAIAGASKCAQVSWSGHGKLPVGYYKGMALAFAKGACRVKDPDDAFGQIVNQPLKSSDKDALAHYAVRAGVLNTYALMIGLGVRESDGRTWLGRDTTASNTSSNTAEAGFLQTSYDSVGAHSQLPKLMAYYKANPSKCRLSVFNEGYRVGSSSNFGSGNGLEFQKLSKSCPMFAAEWSAVILRNLRKHYGPINRKEAQFKSECVDMLGMIQDAVNKSPKVCESL